MPTSGPRGIRPTMETNPSPPKTDNPSNENQHYEATDLVKFIEIVFIIIKNHKPSQDRKKSKTINSPKFAFRGHSSKSYKLLPSIGRIKDYSEEKERTLFNEFRRHYHSYTTHHLDKSIDVLFLAQHYRLKTRLLDWSQNPLVSLYFCCSEKNEDDGVVLVKKIPYSDKELRADESDENRPDWDAFYNKGESLKTDSEPVFILPDNFERRFRHQSGIFECFFNPQKEGTADYTITIPSECKKEILKQLNLMGINEAFVYPDLEHLAQMLSKEEPYIDSSATPEETAPNTPD